MFRVFRQFDDEEESSNNFLYFELRKTEEQDWERITLQVFQRYLSHYNIIRLKYDDVWEFDKYQTMVTDLSVNIYGDDDMFMRY